MEGYVRRQMENDPAFKRAIAELTSANKIVHVALDLGMVQLNRAQTLTTLQHARRSWRRRRRRAGHSGTGR